MACQCVSASLMCRFPEVGAWLCVVFLGFLSLISSSVSCSIPTLPMDSLFCLSLFKEVYVLCYQESMMGIWVREKPIAGSRLCWCPFDKIPDPFLITTLSEVGINGCHFNAINNIYLKPKAGIVLASKGLKALLLMSGTIKPSHSHYYYLTEFWKGTQTREREKTEV